MIVVLPTPFSHHRIISISSVCRIHLLQVHQHLLLPFYFESVKLASWVASISLWLRAGREWRQNWTSRSYSQQHTKGCLQAVRNESHSAIHGCIRGSNKSSCMCEDPGRRKTYRVCCSHYANACSLSKPYHIAINPLLDRKYRLRDYYISLSFESTLLKFTHYLTTPWLFALLAVAYIIGFAFFARAQYFFTPVDSFVGCTSTYWLAKDGCGLDGAGCGPFQDDSPFDFRCPAQCDNVILQNPRTVGDEQIAFVPLIVGGGDTNRTYRGDSFICAAAIQA